MSSEEDAEQDAARQLVDDALRICLSGNFQKALDKINADKSLEGNPLAMYVISFLFLFSSLLLSSS